MAVKPKPDIKTTFEIGDRPTEAEFGDFIDSYVPIETDGAVGFMEVISTASSLARPTETLVAIATAAQSGKTGVIEVLATADVTALPAGAMGRLVLSADATASAQGHLGGAAFGVQVFETATTAAGRDLLNIVTASETDFGIIELATQAEMKAAAAANRAVTPLQTQHHPGVAKAWILFDATGPTINADYGVTSLTDNGAGDFNINWDTAFSSVNYGVTGMVGGVGSDAVGGYGHMNFHFTSPLATGSVRVRMVQDNTGSGANVFVDFVVCSVAAFGDQ